MGEGEATRRLVRYGLTLFLLGLLTGFVIPVMTNPRAGVSGHLEGVMNGTFLVVVGLAWRELALPPRLARIAYVLVLYGAYVNWAATTAAAALGTRSGMPLAAGAHRGGAVEERVMMTLFASVGLTMVAALALLVWGAWRRAATGRDR